MNKLERYRALQQKKRAKLEKAQQDMNQIDQLVQEEENTQILAVVRSYAMTPEELAAFLREQHTGAVPLVPEYPKEQEGMDNETGNP